MAITTVEPKTKLVDRREVVPPPSEPMRSNAHSVSPARFVNLATVVGSILSPAEAKTFHTLEATFADFQARIESGHPNNVRRHLKAARNAAVSAGDVASIVAAHDAGALAGLVQAAKEKTSSLKHASQAWLAENIPPFVRPIIDRCLLKAATVAEEIEAAEKLIASKLKIDFEASNSLLALTSTIRRSREFGPVFSSARQCLSVFCELPDAK